MDQSFSKNILNFINQAKTSYPNMAFGIVLPVEIDVIKNSKYIIVIIIMLDRHKNKIIPVMYWKCNI